MNGKDIFLGLQYIGDDLIQEAEVAALSPAAAKSAPKRKKTRYPLLIAALIALMLLLVGCAIVYVLGMSSVKISTGSETRDYSEVDGVYVKDPHTVSTTTLSLAGLEGSKAYRACADFYAFESEYTARGEEMSQAGTLPEGYWGNYLDIMDAKAQELAERYGLKPEGQVLDFPTVRKLCDGLGVERFVRDVPGVSVDVTGGHCYESGNFTLSMDIRFPTNQGYEVTYTLGQLFWNRQDSFSRDFVTLVDDGTWTERNYTTAAGSQVLLLRSPNQERGYILCNRGEALMTLQLDVNPEFYSEDGGVVSVERKPMTDRQLELVADAIDFAIQPRIPTQADVEAQAAISAGATQNGYTLAVKSVETDGYVARILLGLTAPEDVDLEGLALSFDRNSFTAQNRQFQGGGISGGVVPDGDGLANTVDLLEEYSVTFQDGLRPYELGSVWELNVTDLYVDRRRESSRILTEGDWHFSVTFDETNTDYRELELLTEPTTLKASTGWLADGTDVIEEFPVSSFRLRKFSSHVTWDSSSQTEAGDRLPYADFYAWHGHCACAVLKDGSQIELLGERNEEPIDLEQVDYVLLPDGTRLSAGS